MFIDIDVQLSVLDEGDEAFVSVLDDDVDEAAACPDPLPLPLEAVVWTVTPLRTETVVVVVVLVENDSVSERALEPLEIDCVPFPPA